MARTRRAVHRLGCWRESCVRLPLHQIIGDAMNDHETKLVDVLAQHPHLADARNVSPEPWHCPWRSPRAWRRRVDRMPRVALGDLASVTRRQVPRAFVYTLPSWD